ncbi:MAG TPA: FCD domain-containing protein [Caulobacteraceae bacterium]|jgi:DNA-binding FadR family transcriptional regulator
MPPRKSEKKQDTPPFAVVPPIASGWAMTRRTSKTSEIVALEIVRNIVSQGLKPGDRLPLEAEMLVQYRVSRSSLREALRLLEVQGLIAIRPGPGSGTVVGRVLPGNLARTLTLYLHMTGSTYDELLDAWMAAEPMLARLAAANPDRARVKASLSPFLSEDHGGDHGKWAIDEGLDFHERVAQLADNPVLALILQSIGYIVTEHVLSVTERGHLEERIVHDHSQLAQAIIAGKVDKAGQLMADHVKHVAEDFKAYWPRKIGEKIQWS